MEAKIPNLVILVSELQLLGPRTGYSLAGCDVNFNALAKSYIYLSHPNRINVMPDPHCDTVVCVSMFSSILFLVFFFEKNRIE